MTANNWSIGTAIGELSELALVWQLCDRNAAAFAIACRFDTLKMYRAASFLPIFLLFIAIGTFSDSSLI
jgi:hypothetical protein